jgi:hypothetical protein
MASDDPTPERREKVERRDTPERRGITVRRAPKYVPFLILGGLIGIAAAAIIAYALPASASYDPGTVFGFFMVLCGAGGVILGAIAALLLDRLSVKRAEHAVVEAVPETEESLPGAEQPTPEADQRPAPGHPQQQQGDNGSGPGHRS